MPEYEDNPADELASICYQLALIQDLALNARNDEIHLSITGTQGLYYMLESVILRLEELKNNML